MRPYQAGAMWIALMSWPQPMAAQEPVRCEQLETLALASHPWLARDAARVEASKERAQASGRLDAPELMYQQWAVPLARPYALNQANMVMLGVRQRITLGRLREAQQNVQAAETRIDESQRRVTREEVLREVRLANVSYARAYDELALHVAHVALVHETLELAQIAYASGSISQASLLAGRTMLAELHSEVGSLEADLEQARLQVNALTNRELDTPIGIPCVFGDGSPPTAAPPSPQTLAERRPEIAVATSRVHSARSQLELERTMARSPDLTVGLDYMAMPDVGQLYGYGAVVSMSLPWLQAGRGHAQKAAELSVRETELERAWLLRSAEVEVRRALVAQRTAVQVRQTVETELLPAALQRYEAQRIALSTGKAPASESLEALSDLLGARIALVRAIAAQRAAQVELARALGSTPTPSAPHEVAP